MFKFNFDFEDDVEQQDPTTGCIATNEPLAKSHPIAQEPFHEISLISLLDALPSLISFSPLSIPLSSGRELWLARRDLFDARFQLISDDSGDDGRDEEMSAPAGKNASTALDFLDAPSDLVPGVYEGGLKTWECSVDLVDYLDEIKGAASVRGKRVMEIGCGTAVPTLYLLHEIFSSDELLRSNHPVAETQFHLQDYNSSVLELVTLPNILLAWYMSSASASYRASEDTASAHSKAPGELPISHSLTTAFLTSLTLHGIIIRFFAGSWDTFDLKHTGGKYDTIFSSETIYRTDTLGPLINLLMNACGCREKPIDEAVRSQSSQNSGSSSSPQYLCLIAAKVLYFGVGGGVAEFIRAVEGQETEGVKRKGYVKTVWERNVGVGRRIMDVKWAR